MTRSRGLALGALLTLAAPRPSEAAGPRAVDLHWAAAPGCPDRAEVLADVRAYVGDLLDRPHADPIQAQARVSELGAQWSLELSLTNSGGRAVTQTTAASCRVLGQVTALKIAVALDPVQVLERLAATEAPQGTPVPPPAAGSVAPPRAPASMPTPTPRTHPTPPRRPLRAALRAGAGVGFGTLPKPGVPVTLGAALLLPRLRIEFGGWYWVPRKAHYPERPEVGGLLSLAAGSLDVCPVPRAWGLEFPLCAGLEAGAMLGTGFGVQNPATDARAWLAARLAPAVVFPVHPAVALFVQVLGQFPLVRPGFAIDGLPELHRVSYAAIAGLAGFEVRFGPPEAQAP